jgi:hypothetical protein
MSGTLRTGERIKLDIKLRQDQIRDWAESFTKLANDLTPGDPNWFTQS